MSVFVNLCFISLLFAKEKNSKAKCIILGERLSYWSSCWWSYFNFFSHSTPNGFTMEYNVFVTFQLETSIYINKLCKRFETYLTNKEANRGWHCQHWGYENIFFKKKCGVENIRKILIQNYILSLNVFINKNRLF